MSEKRTTFYFRALLIATEVFLISFIAYKFAHDFPSEFGKYISLDVLYCLPIIQTARLTAIHAARRYDTHASTFVGIALALAWSAAELFISWPDFPILAFALNIFTRSIAFTVIGRVLVKLWREKKYARTDTLTGLGSRLELLEQIKIEQDRSKRSGRPYSLLFIDVDKFKDINDNHGHKFGDKALMILADVLKKNCRKIDLAARLGGDEFVLLLPETDEQSCNFMIDRINSAADQAFSELPSPVSLSIGHTTHIGDTHDAAEAISLADQRMYQYKRQKY